MLIGLLILLWIIYGICKAFSDARRDGETIFKDWLARKGQRWIDWYNGKRGLLTQKVNQGYPWSTDCWHTFDTWRNIFAIVAMIISPFALREYSLWIIILFAWFCYWIPSFALIYHVVLMRDQTFKAWIMKTILFWK